jgi:hypothetical protein
LSNLISAFCFPNFSFSLLELDRRVVGNGWLGRRRGTRFIDEIDDEADQGAKEQCGQHDLETFAEPPPPVAQVRPVN